MDLEVAATCCPRFQFPDVEGPVLDLIGDLAHEARGQAARGLELLESPSEGETLWRKVERSASNAETLIPAVMCVVEAPATVAGPTTLGLLSQCRGWIPNLPNTLEPPPDDEEVSAVKLALELLEGRLGGADRPSPRT